jgi:hypothetical protein
MFGIGDTQAFINVLRQYQESGPDKRSELANIISDAIIAKRVNLASIRQELLESSEFDLVDALEGFLELLGPYIEEGKDEE